MTPEACTIGVGVKMCRREATAVSTLGFATADFPNRRSCIRMYSRSRRGRSGVSPDSQNKGIGRANGLSWHSRKKSSFVKPETW